MAAAYSVCQLCIRVPIIVYCCRVGPVRTRDVLATLWRPAVASLAAGVALAAFDHAAPYHVRPVVGLTIDCCVYGVAYVLAWAALPGGRRIMRETLELTRELRGAPAAA